MLDRRRYPTFAAVLGNLSAMQLELSSPGRSHQTEQPGPCFVELDLSAQKIVRQAHLEPKKYSATAALPAVSDNVARNSKYLESLVLVEQVVGPTESALPEMKLPVVDSDRDVGDAEVVSRAALPADSDSTVAAAVVPVDSS